MARLRAQRVVVGLALVVACAAFGGPVSAAAAEQIGAAADSLRTSWYPDEPQLSPQLVESGDFGLNFTVPVQGQVYAQPLVSGHTLLVATEKNWVYAIDSRSGQVQWEENFGAPWNPADLSPCKDLWPDVGITGTPVIDPSTNVAYFLAKGYEGGGSSGVPIWQMHAVSLADGKEQPGFPVTISGYAENVTGVSGEAIPFEPKQLLQRPGLLLMNGVVYAAFGGNCDTPPFQGWIAGVSTTSAEITTLWTDAKGNGGSIWQSGGGLISDGEGQIIFTSGQGWSPLPGPGDEPHEGNLGSAVVRLQVEPDGHLKAKDFFAPYNSEELDREDWDLGSGAPLALPSPYFGTATTPHLLVQAGKAGELYLLNRDELGGRKPESSMENASLQEISLGGGVWASLAAWPGDGGYVYVPTVSKTSKSLHFLAYGTNSSGEPELTPDGEAGGFEYGSGSPIVTSNGTTSGSAIVWISRCVNPGAGNCEGSFIDAYAAVPSGGTPHLLWSHEIGITSKFGRAQASEGRVYVGTRSDKILAFGALHHTLTVSREDAVGGTVSSDRPGIVCGATCSHPFENGATVTLSATPASGYAFTGWSEGGCSGTGSCQVTLYADNEVTAHFAPVTEPPPPIGPPAPGSNNGGAPAGEAPPPPPSLASPDTSLKKATIDRKRGTATFKVAGTASTERFQCKLVKPGKKPSRVRFRRCGNSRTYKHLAPGGYLFEARAVNAAGPDTSPVRRRFRI